MSLFFYFFSVAIAIVIAFGLIMIIGVPLLLVIFKILTKYEFICWEKRRRIKISLVSCLIIFGVYSLWIMSEMYRTDWALEYVEKTNNLSLPYYFVKSVNFPGNWNHADDFGVDKSLKFIYSPSKKDLEEIYYLCDTDDRWSKVDSIITFEETVFENEVVYEVVINLSNNMVDTKYHKW
jgi:hypothetical protein